MEKNHQGILSTGITSRLRELGAQEYTEKDFQGRHKDDNRDFHTALGADMNPGILDKKDTETEAEG